MGVRVSDEVLAAHGIAREELLTNGEKLFIDWVAGSLASSPFTTTSGVLMDRALEGKWKVRSFGDFTGLVFDDMAQSGALGGFLTYGGHASGTPAATAGEPATPRHAAGEPTGPTKPLAEGSGPTATDDASTGKWRRRVGEGSGPVPADEATTGRWERPQPAGEGPISDGVPEPIGEEAASRPTASDGVPEPIHDEPTTEKHVDPDAPVIEESPPGGFEPTTAEPPAEDTGPEPAQEEVLPEEVGDVESDGVPEPIHDEPTTEPHLPRGGGTPPSAAPPVGEEAAAHLAQAIKRARPYNRRPPGGGRGGGGGGGGRRPRTPKPEIRVKADARGPERVFHGSVKELRKHLAQALEEAHTRAERGRQPGAAPEIDGLIAEVAKTDPAFAAKAKTYFDALADPKFLEDQMTYLWRQARDHGRTVAGELEHILGGGKPPNEFRNTPDLKPEESIAEFREALRDPRPLVDLSFAGDFHGSHTHLFHQFLGDRLFGAGEGLTFRQRLAELAGPTKTVKPGSPDQFERPFWSQLWDAMFDAGGGLHSPEELGKILQHHLDFPRWDPPPT